MYMFQVTSDVWRVHCVHGGEPVVLFQRGAVRLLDSLLSAPQQPIEEVLVQEEAIRSVSLCLTAPGNPLLQSSEHGSESAEDTFQQLQFVMRIHLPNLMLRKQIYIDSKITLNIAIVDLLFLVAFS